MTTLKDNKMDNLKFNFKEKGYKYTKQRQYIIDVLLKNGGKHLSVEEIYDKVKEYTNDIGVATVYRTIQLLEEFNFVYKIDFNDGCSRYEIMNKDENHMHHHLICNLCGSVNEVDVDLMDELEMIIEDKYNFHVTNHSTKFYGICNKCRKNYEIGG